jgi:RecA-family ATPase
MNAKAKDHTRIAWNTVQPKEITWLWHGKLPFGKISIISGNSGLGKTLVSLDIAARLTTGRPMPLSDAEPITGNVLFQSLEDDLSDTLLARCISAGADCSRIASIQADGLNFDEDCDIIEQHIRETGARLLVADPVQSFLGRSADMCRITDIRRVLSNLGGVAARSDCAVILIAHQNKNGGANDLHRVFGSVDLTAVARSVMRISASENDPDIRIIKHIKSSISRPCEPIAFRIEDDASIVYLDDYNDKDGSEEESESVDKRAKAMEIICSMLADGPKEGTAVFKVCKDAGISSRTVERVKKDLDVRSERDGVKRIWVLPTA